MAIIDVGQRSRGFATLVDGAQALVAALTEATERLARLAGVEAFLERRDDGAQA